MPIDPACQELADELIGIKARLRKISQRTARLNEKIEDFAASPNVVECGLYQIDFASDRMQVANAVVDLEQAHRALSDLHRRLKDLCEERDIPIPPDPEPEGGGGR